jgi:hypothetical protein
MKNNHSERRSSGRFPIHQEVRYSLLEEKGRVEGGLGRTIDMSSRGILFTTIDPLHTGRRIEVAVNWPARLDGTCRLKLVAMGRVVRSEGQRAAIVIEQYEFRTQRANAFQAAAAAPPLAMRG